MSTNGILTTHTLGWYGSYTTETGDYCLPFLIDEHSDELSSIIALSNSSESLKFKAWGQSTPFECGVGGIVYAKNNSPYVIDEFHSGHLDQASEFYGVRPPTQYFLEFKVYGLTDAYFDANSDTGTGESKPYKLTDIIKNKKPVYKKIFENWFILWDDDAERYILADGLNDYTKYLFGQTDKPNGIFYSPFDTNITGISEGVENRSVTAVCEVEVAYDIRTYTGAWFKKAYTEYYESLGMKDDDSKTLIETSRYPNQDGHFKIRNFSLSTEIGRGFGSKVNPSIQQTTDVSGVSAAYKASVNETCDISATEEAVQENEGAVVDSLIERYDAKYVLSETVFDEIVNMRTLLDASASTSPRVLEVENQPTFVFESGRYLSIYDSVGSAVFNSSEFSVFMRFQGNPAQVLISKWKQSDVAVFPTASFKLYGNKLQTNENTYLFNKTADDDAWNTLMLTFNRTTQRINVYLNKENVLSATSTENDFGHSDEPFIIGGWMNSLSTIESFEGALTDVRIYNQEFFTEVISIISDGLDYDSNEPAYYFEEPYAYDKSPRTDGGVLFAGDVYSKNSSAYELVDIRTASDVLVASYITPNGLMYEFYHNTDSSWEFSYQYSGASSRISETADFVISDSYFVIRDSTSLRLYSTSTSPSGKINSISLISEISSSFSAGVLLMNSAEDTIVLRDGTGKLVVYDVSAQGLSPKSFGIEMEDISHVTMLDDLILVVNSTNFYSVFEIVAGTPQLRHNTTISDEYSIENCKLLKTPQTGIYHIATTHIANTPTGQYPDRFKSIPHIDYPVGHVKLRTLDTLNKHVIEHTPFQQIWPPYSEFGLEFFELTSFGSSVESDGSNLIIGSPEAFRYGDGRSEGLVWWYGLSQDETEFVFSSRVFHATHGESKFSKFGKHMQLNGQRCQIQSEYTNPDTDKTLVLSEFELSTPVSGIVDFLEYGYNLLAWYEFNGIYSQSHEGDTFADRKYAIFDRSGRNNHLNCTFQSDPRRNAVVGPTDGGMTYRFNSSSFCTTSIDLSEKSFTINLWYMPTRLSSPDGRGVLISTHSELNSNAKNGFKIHADGSVTVGDVSMTTYNETELIVAEDTWYMLTVVYDHEFGSVWTYVNSDFKKNSENVEMNFTSSAMTIGGTNVGVNPFFGYIDDIKIYDTAMSSTSITEEFEKSWKNHWMKT